MTSKVKLCVCAESVPCDVETATESSGGSMLGEDSGSEASLERGNWGHKLDFLLSCVGYAVGLGNLWRFPYLCMRNGGGAFLIPYFLFLLLCGIPLYFMELAFGQFASCSPLTIWGVCPLFKGVGYAMVLVSGLVCIYYNVILAWAFYYIVMSFTTGSLPWSTCDNWWNTPGCVERYSVSGNASNISVVLASLLTTASYNSSETPLLHKPMTSAEEFWKYNVLQQTESADDLGGVRWELGLSLAFAWIVVYLCMFKGIQSSGKVVYVTAIAPFIMLFVFLVRGLTLPGAYNGIMFYLTPDFNRLRDFQVWLEACAQIFYSLGVAYGSLITMASYNKFHHNCYRYALVIPLINCATSFLAGFTIFSVIGFMAQEANLPVEQVITSGPGLAFVAYPEALTKLPISPMWAVLFFLMLIIIGLDTQFGMFECLTSGFIDVFPKTLMHRKSLFTALLCAVQLLLGLPLVTKGGIYLFQIFDWYCATFALITISLLECIALAWVYGVNRLYLDIEMMIGYKPCFWWKICWVFITPVILLVVLVTTIVQFTEPTYGDYIYPGWALGLGWFLATVSLIPIPVFIVIGFIQAQGSFKERLHSLVTPTSTWGPALKCNRTGPYYSETSLSVKEKQPSLKVIGKQECDEVGEALVHSHTVV